MRPGLLFTFLFLLAPASLLTALAYGSVELSLSQIFTALISPDAGANSLIVWELRLPRAFSAFACGALLAVAGVLLQILIRNPLAEPYVLGIAGGASVGAIGAVFFGLGLLGMRTAALLGALVTIWLVFTLSYRQAWNLYRLLLTGVVLSAGFAALVSLMLILAPPIEARGMLYWLMGDFSAARTPGWPWLVLVLVLGFGLHQARALNVLAAGEVQAKALGLAVSPLQIGIYVAASLATAIVVTEAGTIGFVGLIIPHAIRLLGVSDHRYLIPASALLGGSFLTLADLAARTVAAPQQLPVGAVTALIGVPMLLWLLGRRT